MRHSSFQLYEDEYTANNNIVMQWPARHSYVGRGSVSSAPGAVT